ncbi:twin-arginine translocation pathway signal protein [Bordetella genomosp. 8]|uniref:Twin-arginine translocation pathway signal protein n=1 Tax=Bordetella genomosp. 8 TaxID=1416806 RepID=A0A1W6YQ98_9BORD|nr:lipid-binding SYLF domain-containing protein [Bordetella genomosp. 8]ARP83270.1 twin-arginine translocation pathway signal protein [Bordetella genomosp. 8]
MNRIPSLAFACFLLLALTGCGGPTVATGGDPTLDREARQALEQLFAQTPEANSVVRPKAKAVVVFPNIVKAGFIFGAQGGKGVMFDRDGKVVAYYRVRGVSYGLQAGAQAYSEALFLMTDEAITELTSGAGLSLGVGPSVVVVDVGAAKSLTTTTLKADVYAFIFGQEGLMAGLGVQGQRIVKFDD